MPGGLDKKTTGDSLEQSDVTTMAGSKGGDPPVSNIACFNRSQSESAGGDDGDEDEEDYSTSADSQTLVRMLEDHEKVSDC